MAEPPDATLVAQVAAFHRDTFSLLVRVAMYAGASVEQAKDAAGQTMLEVFRGWAGIADPRAWACRAVVTNFVKVKQRDAQRLALTVAGGQATPELDDDPAMIVWEDRQWVADLLSRLPPAQREVMVLILDGRGSAEVAVLLGKTPTAVRKNLEKARERLRQELHREREQERLPRTDSETKRREIR